MFASLLVVGLLGPVPTGQALLDTLSRRTVNYFYEQSFPETGFTRDRAANFEIKDQRRVASIAATGFSLAALAIGAKRGWLDEYKAKERTITTLNALLTKAPRKNGWYYHWLDWQTGARVWESEVSTIDTAILVGGAILAKQAWRDKTISAKVDKIIAGIDWKWMLTDGGSKPTSITFTHGWKPEKGFIEHRWRDYSEQMILYLLALGADTKIPANTWEGFTRDPVRYEGIDLLMGGPLFMHQMTQGFFDFKNKRDRLGYDYWVASRAATLANRKYCIVNPKKYAGYGPDCWGLSAGDGPNGYKAYGAPHWGDDEGTIIPTSAISSILYTPELSRRAAEHFATNYAWAFGRYGFSNGFNPGQKWRSDDVIGIDLGMCLLAIENSRDGLPYKWTMSSPIVRRGFARAGFQPSRAPSDKNLKIRAE